METMVWVILNLSLLTGDFTISSHEYTTQSSCIAASNSISSELAKPMLTQCVQLSKKDLALYKEDRNDQAKLYKRLKAL
jgi:hypothetical protein